MRSLFGSWERFIWWINESRGAHLEALPRTPTLEEIRSEAQWIREFVETCDNIMRALLEDKVIEILDPFVIAIESGEAVPPDLRQPVIDLNNGWILMFLNLRPKAINWVTRSEEVFKLETAIDEVVAEWAEGLGMSAHPGEAEVSRLREANRGSERLAQVELAT